jgi:subfamily B ATP-binding cassette protein MsbA
MKRILRLLYYMRRYWIQALGAIVLMAAVGLLEAFRVLLVQPIFDHVLNPGRPNHPISLFSIPGTHYHFTLQQFVPSNFHNPWNIVAFALVVSTLLKSVCDYAGTFLVNYAGFGMITDLRDDLYEAVLRRSVSFFQKHATGTLLSTLINDIERVQYAMSSVLSEFLQQFFTLVFTIGVVIHFGGKLAWALLIFVPVVIG